MLDPEIPRRRGLPHLDFDDQDLTDAFHDIHDGSSASTSALGHPRGSTPLSVLSSRHSTPSTQAGSNTGIKAMPNMSALLDFLESDSFATSLQPSLLHSAANQSELLDGRSSVVQRGQLDVGQSLQDAENLRLIRDPTNLPSDLNQAIGSPRSNPDQDTGLNPLFTRPPPPPGTPVPPQGRLAGPISSAPTRQTCHSSRPRELSQPSSSSPARSGQPSQATTPRSSTLSPRSGPSGLTSAPPKTTAADRMAAALMEGAPDANWTVPEHAIRRSKIVEELLQPIRPSPLINILQEEEASGTSRRDDSATLPRSLLIQVRANGSPLDLAGSRSRDRGHHGAAPAARFHDQLDFRPALNFVTPAKHQRLPSSQPLPPEPSVPHQDLAPLPLAEDDSLDQRVTDLLSHIRADQIEKTHLALALTEARAEVSALRDEVRLLRISVERLTDERGLVKRSTLAESKEKVATNASRKRPWPPLPAVVAASSHGRDLGRQNSRLRRDGDGDGNAEFKFEKIQGPSGLTAEPGGENPGSKPGTSSKTPPDLDPSNPLITTTTTAMNPSSITHPARMLLTEIALSLTFTRTIDSLVHQPPSNVENRQTLPKRTDEQVFKSANLDELICRIKLWKHVARSSSRSSRTGVSQHQHQLELDRKPS